MTDQSRLPDLDGLRPPVVAESGDPFAAVRIVAALAEVPRGRPLPIRDLVDRLNATYPDWLFDARVVADALVQLQANWMADYRNATGIVLEDGDRGSTVTIEDSTRVSPWLALQAGRAADRCRSVLDEFSRRDRLAGEG